MQGLCDASVFGHARHEQERALVEWRHELAAKPRPNPRPERDENDEAQGKLEATGEYGGEQPREEARKQMQDAEDAKQRNADERAILRHAVPAPKRHPRWHEKHAANGDEQVSRRRRA